MRLLHSSSSSSSSSSRLARCESFDLIDLSRERLIDFSRAYHANVTIAERKLRVFFLLSASLLYGHTCIFPYIHIYTEYYIYIYIFIYVHVQTLHCYKGLPKASVTGHVDGAVLSGIDEDKKLSATHRLKLVSDVACCCSLLI